MKNNDYNFNYSECLKEKDNLTNREIINVCTGETTKINYGIGDWIIIIFILVLILSVISLFVAGIVSLIKDY